MPFRTKNTYSVPGKGTYNTKKKTYAGSGAAPSGYRSVPAPTYETVPVTTVRNDGTRTVRPPTTSPSGGPLNTLSGSHLLAQIEDLLTPGPMAADIAHAASALGVKPKGVQSAAGSIVSDVAKGVSEMGENINLAAALPNKRVDSVLGRKTLGTPTIAQLLKAASQTVERGTQPQKGHPTGQTVMASRRRGGRGGLQVNQAGKLTTPEARRAAQRLAHLREIRSRIGGPLPGLDPEQQKVVKTVLRVGDRAGATLKEKLAAVETALVESGARNLGYGDADSEGWRQERTSIYGTGPTGPRNVKASARRFFNESVSDTGGTRGAGMTAGQLAQTIQGSAFPERYDQVKGRAGPILRAYEQGGQPGPRLASKLQTAEAAAHRLGISTKVARGGDLERGPGGKIVYVRADGKGMVDWAHTLIGTVEGSPKQHSWADQFGLSYSQPWCADFISAGLARRGIAPPPNPNYVPSYEREWAGGQNIGTDLSKAKPGDLLTFSGAHIGVYVGNGQMISGNSSDAVSQTPVDYGGPPLSAILRPKYKGGKVAVRESTPLPGSAVGPGGVAVAAPAGAGVGAAAARGRGGTAAGSSLPPLSALLATSAPLPTAYGQYQLGEEPTTEGGDAESLISRLRRGRRA